MCLAEYKTTVKDRKRLFTCMNLFWSGCWQTLLQAAKKSRTHWMKACRFTHCTCANLKRNLVSSHPIAPPSDWTRVNCPVPPFKSLVLHDPVPSAILHTPEPVPRGRCSRQKKVVMDRKRLRAPCRQHPAASSYLQSCIPWEETSSEKSKHRLEQN